jgi:hypothetical protein
MHWTKMAASTGRNRQERRQAGSLRRNTLQSLTKEARSADIRPIGVDHWSWPRAQQFLILCEEHLMSTRSNVFQLLIEPIQFRVQLVDGYAIAGNVTEILSILASNSLDIYAGKWKRSIRRSACTISDEI